MHWLCNMRFLYLQKPFTAAKSYGNKIWLKRVIIIGSWLPSIHLRIISSFIIFVFEEMDWPKVDLESSGSRGSEIDNNRCWWHLDSWCYSLRKVIQTRAKIVIQHTDTLKYSITWQRLLNRNSVHTYND